MRNSRTQTAAIATLSMLLLSVTSSSCTTTYSKRQAADNAVILAQAFVDCVWEIDPETYFDDQRLAAHAFRQAPRAMTSAEYHGRPSVVAGSGLTGGQRFEESRVFSLDLPMVRANAVDGRREPSELVAQFCMQVSVRYEADAAVYHFEFFSPRIAVDDGQRLIRDGNYVADLRARSGYGIPVSADVLAAELRKLGVPLDFAGDTYEVSGDYNARRTGAEFLVGSGRILVTEGIDRDALRLNQLQAIVRLRDGVTAREFYDGVLEVKSVRQALAEHSRELTNARRSRAGRIARAQAKDHRDRERVKRRELAARRARDTDMFLDVLSESANELGTWQRQQSAQSYGVHSLAQSRRLGHQNALEDSYEKGRRKGEIAAAERKLAAQRRRLQQHHERQVAEGRAKVAGKLEDEVRSLKARWHDFAVELVVAGRDLLRADFVQAQSKYESLQADRLDLDHRLQAAGQKPTRLASHDAWFEFGKKKLHLRSQGVRSRLINLRAASGEKWSEHFVAKVAGVEFYQRVRARKWPDKVVDLTWRVVNTNKHPVWHSLKESAPASGMKFYLWGGSALKAKASHLHEWVSYEPDRGSWTFEGFVRREN